MFGRKQRRHTVVDTLVGANTKVNGDLNFEGGCHVDGTVKGNVSADPDSDSALSVSEDGNVEGGFVPTFNALNMFEVPQDHAVSYVAPFAPGIRYSITLPCKPVTEKEV